MYKIKKGRHYSSGINVGVSVDSIFKYAVKFENNCIYHIDGNDRYDINKLFGYSTDIYHHIGSVRFGWRCLNNETIEILSYTYDDGKRLDSKVLCEVYPGENFTCILDIKNDKCEYTVINSKGKYTHTDFLSKKSYKLKYKLFPYFGGDKCAPHMMNINLEKI